MLEEKLSSHSQHQQRGVPKQAAKMADGKTARCVKDIGQTSTAAATLSYHGQNVPNNTHFPLQDQSTQPFKKIRASRDRGLLQEVESNQVKVNTPNHQEKKSLPHNKTDGSSRRPPFHSPSLFPAPPRPRKPQQNPSTQRPSIGCPRRPAYNHSHDYRSDGYKKQITAVLPLVFCHCF